MAALAVPALARALLRRAIQASLKVCFRDVFDICPPRKCTPIEAVAEIVRQRFLVCEEPGFHALNHEVGVFVRSLGGFTPIVAFSQVRPRTGILGHRSFAIHQ